MRWIDPDVWGFRAWSVLFAIARRVTISQSKQWRELVHLLPYILPCFTCRCCCAKFIKRNPPEQTPASPVAWLSALRREVAFRNLKSNDCNRLDLMLAKGSIGLTVYEDQDRFAKRERVPDLWRMDAFLFLACVAMTQDLTNDRDRRRWNSLMSLLLSLSPLELKLASQDGHRSVDEALTWITSSPLCHGDALVAALANVTVKLRTITPTVKPNPPKTTQLSKPNG